MADKKQSEIKSVVFLGDSGFPLGWAAIQRITLMGRALLAVGCEVNVVCRIGVWGNDVKTHYGKEGVHQGIKYMYTPDSPFRSDDSFTRKYQKVKGLVKEFFYLRKLKKEGRIDAVILSTLNFDDSFRYKIYSMLIGFPIAINLVEMASGLKRRSSFKLRIQDWLMENWLLKHFNGAMPISDNLYDFYEQIAPKKPNMKVPVICDYDGFAKVQRNPKEPYLLYCSSIQFKEVTRFVLKAYQAIKSKRDTKLYLLISGKQKDQIDEFREEIMAMFPEGNVKLFSNISYEALMQLFTDANAMLIPLRPNIEDSARFPHKIGEYLATANPVVTTNIGEIKTYFNDNETAYIAETYSIQDYAEKMQYVIHNHELSRQVGKRGKDLGLKTFHYKNYGLIFKEFLQKL